MKGKALKKKHDWTTLELSEMCTEQIGKWQSFLF